MGMGPRQSQQVCGVPHRGCAATPYHRGCCVRAAGGLFAELCFTKAVETQDFREDRICCGPWKRGCMKGRGAWGLGARSLFAAGPASSQLLSRGVGWQLSRSPTSQQLRTGCLSAMGCLGPPRPTACPSACLRSRDHVAGGCNICAFLGFFAPACSHLPQGCPTRAQGSPEQSQQALAEPRALLCPRETGWC